MEIGGWTCTQTQSQILSPLHFVRAEWTQPMLFRPRYGYPAPYQELMCSWDQVAEWLVRFLHHATCSDATFLYCLPCAQAAQYPADGEVMNEGYTEQGGVEGQGEEAYNVSV